MTLKGVSTLAALLPALALSVSDAAPSGKDRVDYAVTDVPPGRPAPPFSEGIRTGSEFYISGHIGRDPATQRAPSDPEAEARLVMDAIAQTLSRAGLGWDDVVAVTVYCTDLSAYDHFNTVYRTYFHGRFPTRTLVGVKDLLFGARFEVNGIARVPGGKAQAAPHG